MRHRTGPLEAPVTERGVHCVWVPVRDETVTRLTARWVGPQTAPSGMHVEDLLPQDEAVPAVPDQEGRRTWLRISLQFV